MGIMNRIKSGWDAFSAKDDVVVPFANSSSYRPDQRRLTPGTEQTILSSVYNRIAIDVADVKIRHVRTDPEGLYQSTISSGLNQCLSVSANVDQTGNAFIVDVVLSMLDEGCVAIVPVEATADIRLTSSFDVISMRTGKIVEWMPYHVKVRVYNEFIGDHREITLPKETVAIVENPFYAIMNQHNSTLFRLRKKLALMDDDDAGNYSSKMNMLLKLPYPVKTETRKAQADERIKRLEDQIKSSEYGIGYIDAVEEVVQLGRSMDNHLLSQVEYFTKMLYAQLGVTTDVLDGTASAEAMNNYYNRVVKPILTSITAEITRKFLTKTARTQGHQIMFFNDPFSLIPITQVADAGSKLTQSQIASSNEIRSKIGLRPSSEPQADSLANPNINPIPQVANPADGYGYIPSTQYGGDEYA